MTKLKLIILISIFSITTAAYADSSFRLKTGKLISIGQSKSKVIALAGAPLYQEVETIGVDNGNGFLPTKREILTYELAGSIGGDYLVVVSVENNAVVSVTSTQESRL